MQKLLTALSLTAALLLAGCATAPRDTASSAPAATPSTSTAPAAPPASPAAQATAPVKIPAVSARKLVVVMAGPPTVVESKDWPEMKREWRETFAEHAKTAGIAFTFADAAPAPANEDGTLVLVQVADYRIVGIGMRIFFGVMTGNAFIDARLTYANLRDGSKFGEQQYNTSSSAWGGIFAKVTPQQVDQIATGVFAELKAAK